MSEETTLNKLHTQCDTLGIKYHHRTGEDKLNSMIGAFLLEHPEKALLLYDNEQVGVPAGPAQWPIDKDAKAMTEAEYKEWLGPATRKSCSALKRVIIQCMDPAKREWPGENISVGSSKFGTYKKHIPFNGEPYHIPKIIYDFLKERKCTIYETVQNHDGRGGSVRRGKSVAAFNIVDLPPLTPEELKKLADKQALAKAGL